MSFSIDRSFPFDMKEEKKSDSLIDNSESCLISPVACSMATNRMMQLRRRTIENTTCHLRPYRFDWLQLKVDSLHWEKKKWSTTADDDRRKRRDLILIQIGWGWSLCWECHIPFGSPNVVCSSLIRNELVSVQLPSFDLFSQILTTIDPSKSGQRTMENEIVSPNRVSSRENLLFDSDSTLMIRFPFARSSRKKTLDVHLFSERMNGIFGQSQRLSQSFLSAIFRTVYSAIAIQETTNRRSVLEWIVIGFSWVEFVWRGDGWGVSVEQLEEITASEKKSGKSLASLTPEKPSVIINRSIVKRICSSSFHRRKSSFRATRVRADPSRYSRRWTSSSVTHQSNHRLSNPIDVHWWTTTSFHCTPISPSTIKWTSSLGWRTPTWFVNDPLFPLFPLFWWFRSENTPIRCATKGTRRSNSSLSEGDSNDAQDAHSAWIQVAQERSPSIREKMSKTTEEPLKIWQECALSEPELSRLKKMFLSICQQCSSWSK